MPTPQRRLGSRFGARSTADEILDGLDLSGRYVVVTGGYSGIGLEAVRALAKAGADIVVPARRVAHAEQQLADVPRASTVALDLGVLESVRACARSVLEPGRPIDVLINNAAVMAVPETRVGPGWESQFVTNHLGHYVLTNLLWPLLAAEGGARVVALTSLAHKRSAIRWDDVMFHRTSYEKWLAYAQSKTANALFALRLDALGAADGVRGFSVHPGAIFTPLQRHLIEDEFRALGWIDEHGNAAPSFKTVEQGAATTCWAAASPQVEGMGGVYCEDADIADRTEELPPPLRRRRGVDAHACDPGEAERLWALSARLTGIDAFVASPRSRTRPRQTRRNPAMLDPRIRALLAGPNFAHLATVMADGSPHSAPVWVDVEGDDLVLAKQQRSVALRNLRRDARVALSIHNVEDPYETAYVRGRVKELREGEVAIEWLERTAVSYTGEAYPPPIPTAVTLVVIDVERAGYGHFTRFQHTPPDARLQLPRACDVG